MGWIMKYQKKSSELRFLNGVYILLLFSKFKIVYRFYKQLLLIQLMLTLLDGSILRYMKNYQHRLTLQTSILIHKQICKRIMFYLLMRIMTFKKKGKLKIKELNILRSLADL